MEAENTEKKLKTKKGIYKELLALIAAIGVVSYTAKSFSKQKNEFDTYKGTRDLYDYEDFLEEQGIDYRQSYAEAKDDTITVYVKTPGEHIVGTLNPNTIDDIAAFYGMKKEDLLLMNNLKEDQPLELGTKLKIYWYKDYKFSLEELDENSRFIYYEIRPGETLSQIAEQYDTTVGTILKNNEEITNADEIQAFSTIKIPKKQNQKTKTEKKIS